MQPYRQNSRIGLCGALIAEIIVESNDTLRFRLHNGLELRESIERTVR